MIMPRRRHIPFALGYGETLEVPIFFGSMDFTPVAVGISTGGMSQDDEILISEVPGAIRTRSLKWCAASANL